MGEATSFTIQTRTVAPLEGSQQAVIDLSDAFILGVRKLALYLHFCFAKCFEILLWKAVYYLGISLKTHPVWFCPLFISLEPCGLILYFLNTKPWLMTVALNGWIMLLASILQEPSHQGLLQHQRCDTFMSIKRESESPIFFLIKNIRIQTLHGICDGSNSQLACVEAAPRRFEVSMTSYGNCEPIS